MKIEDFCNEIELSQYEKQTYVTLLQIGTAKARDISKKSKVSYGRIYEILEKLESKGLISVIPSEPKTFEAIEPKNALKNFLRRKEEKLQTLKQEIDNLVIPKKETEKINKDTTIVLQGKQKQLNMINDMHHRAKKEILMIPGVYEPNTSRKTATIRALRKGIEIKRLIRKVTNKNKGFLEESIKLGEKIKENSIPGLRLIVTDNKEAMISIVNTKSNDRISIYTTNKDFASSLSIFFNSVWDKSKKINLKRNN
ncbi:TrmB family transcriptional regulator [Candidatus Woesearchaeota archaeon]|nr:TrmB family transcriptional regulator [Candidatus Woesearchaeota archaeon]